MGLLLNLLTFPVTGPLKGVAWVAEQVAEMAEEELQEKDAHVELAELERAWMFGEIDEDEYHRREEQLWLRLRGGAAGVDPSHPRGLDIEEDGDDH
jgi:hypothetical protein